MLDAFRSINSLFHHLLELLLGYEPASHELNLDRRPVLFANGVPSFKLDQQLLLGQPLNVFQIHADAVVLQIPGC